MRELDKPIIATGFAGVVLSSEPWKKAHQEWFEKAAEKLDDSRIKKLADKPDYFKHVDQLMKKMHSGLSEKERTIKARESYMEMFCRHISLHPEKYINQEMVRLLNILKKDYRIALITTNTSKRMDIILSLSQLQGLFNIIECSAPDEKDDKKIVFKRFLEFYGKPVLYIGGSSKQSYEFCKDNNIHAVYANLEFNDTIAGVETVHSVEGLKKLLHDQELIE